MKETVTFSPNTCAMRGVVFSRWKKTTIRLPFIRVRRIVSGNGPAISEIPRASCAATSPRMCTIIRGDAFAFTLSVGRAMCTNAGREWGGNENFQIYEIVERGNFGVVVRAFKNIGERVDDLRGWQSRFNIFISLPFPRVASQIYRRPVHFSVSRAATKCPR